jgi:type II secretory pathway predicted ATPase ExeA
MSKAKNEDRVPQFSLPFVPIILKELVLASDISQGELAEITGASRPTINLCLNRGYIPETFRSFCQDIEKHLSTNVTANSYLATRGLRMSDIWLPLGKELRQKDPAGRDSRRARAKQLTAVSLGANPEEIISYVEAEMITQEARKHFKLFRDPFPANGGVEKDGDVFMSDDHRFIEASMLDAAKHSGLIAIVGQVGSGKSVIRKRVFELLRKEGGILTVFPQILDKDKITSSVLCDAIIMDVSDQKPKIKHEHKARQVKDLLLERSRNGDRCCLVIEEAHNLTVPAFKTLKQLWELEDGYNKLISIVLIGQNELGDKLDERHHPEMREVIRRIQIARIQGLGDYLKEYLHLKFKRIGAKLEDIFTDDALDALSKRLTTKDDRGKAVSHAYPLTVNLHAVRAINYAQEIGETKVTADVVEAI